MITHLRIQNVALIDEADVTFGPGLNVLTGETGAGKSIVVDSINFMLGERPGRDFVRAGAESASVAGMVEVRDESLQNAITDLGVDIPDHQLLIHRTMQPFGKSVCRVNGRAVTVGMLKEISALLVDIHGQHEHQSLLNINKQLYMLDQFCPPMLNIHKQDLERLLLAYRDNGKAIKALAGVGDQGQSQLDIWKYQLSEIQNAKLGENEEEGLAARRARLSGLEKLNTATAEALFLLSGDGTGGAAVDKLGRVLHCLHEIGRLDTEKESLAVSLTEGLAIVTDVAAELRAYSDELDADPRELERIEARLDVIYRLKKKYGPTVADVLAHYKRLQRQMEQLVNSGQELKRLRVKRRELTGEITSVCAKITAIRKEQAVVIQEGITRVLSDLGMTHARFEIQVQPKTAFGPEGNDRVEFLISPNPGEALKPLTRIASGGEMSRVMLAVKTILADADSIQTLIFDEVDAGVSGRTAQQVAEKLMNIARGRQILCITHLPQIAAMADTHFLINKKTDGRKTHTFLLKLDYEEIIQELARLIGGARITDATLRAAGEMKQQADKLK
jgi:DNA repair protein RecN (Recombination protein N)